MSDGRGALQVVAGPEVADLGASFTGAPVRVAGVREDEDEDDGRRGGGGEENLWADIVGLVRGQQLLEVNGAPVCTMTKEELRDALQARPVELRLAHCRTTGDSSWE
ncbi:unnamed protein product, partial [Prorocentrum cordatum]